MRIAPILRLFAATIALATSSVIAATIPVPTQFNTIQHAIDFASDGDTVLVDHGTYVENIIFRGKKIIVASRYLLTHDPADIIATVIDGSNPVHADTASCVLFGNHEDTTSVIDGFTLTGGKGTVWKDIHNNNFYREGGGVLSDVASPTIRNNWIINNDASNGVGVTSCGGGGIRCGDGNPHIYNNVIMQNRGKYGGGVVLNYSGAVIRNNVIYGNTGGEDFGGSGIWTFASGPGAKIVENNTIIENSSALDGGGVLVQSTTMTLRNNIIWGNTAPTGAGISVAGGNAFVTYSDVQGGYAGTGNINADPLLMDSSARLAPSSPCLDAGTPLSQYNDVEDPAHAGNALLPSLGSIRNDMGAYGGPGSLFPVFFTLHFGAPRPPRAITAVSDYQTPRSIHLHWTDPESTKSGTVLTNFKIRIYRNGVYIATVDSGVQSFTDTGLTKHALYRYLLRAKTPTDSSQVDSALAYAGGAAAAATPSQYAVTDQLNGIQLSWRNPSGQADNTALNDFAKIIIYRDGVPFDSIAQSSADTGASRSWTDVVSGFHSYAIAAQDNETPVNLSVPTSTILGAAGFSNEYVSGFDSGSGMLYRTGSWDNTSSIAYDGTTSLTDSPVGNYAANSASYFILPNVVLPTHASLSFRDIAVVRNGAVYVEISTDHRNTWVPLKAYNWSAHTQWSDGHADPGDWFEEKFDLRAYEGDTINIRFRLSSTSTLTADGWYIDAVRLGTTPKQTVSLNLAVEWNMVSVPVERDSNAVADLFSSAESKAFSFFHGYRQNDTLTEGLGYWIKVPAAQVVDVTGYPVAADTVNVKTGWNIIGTVSGNVDSAAVVSQPSGIVQSSYYGYDAAYSRSTTLEPGKAYWVKVSGNGSLILHSTTVAIKPE